MNLPEKLPRTAKEQKRIDEINYWRKLLKQHDNVITRAARAAGINRSHAYALLRRLGFKWKRSTRLIVPKIDK